MAQTKLVYEYIKGHKVTMEEHMLSATEIASMYGLETLKHNPNGLLVSQIISDYIKATNLNISEYYYPHKRGVMRVYPEYVYKKALDDFVFGLTPFKEDVYVAKYEKKMIKFQYVKFDKLEEPIVIPLGPRIGKKKGEIINGKQ